MILDIVMNFLLIPHMVMNQSFVPEKTKAAVSKVFVYLCTRDNDSFIESMETMGLPQKQFFFENFSSASTINQDCAKLASALKRVLECMARGYFDRKTLKAASEIKDFDQGFSEMVQRHLKSDLSLLSLVEYIISRINDFMTSDDSY